MHRLILALFTSALIARSAEPVKPGGLFVNLPADGIVDFTPWPGEIDKLSKPQIEQALGELVKRYARGNVRALLFNVNYQRTCFETDAWDTYWKLPDPSKVGHWQRNFWKLHKAGVDPFSILIRDARKAGISPWISFRMNDHHYFDDPARVNTYLLDDASARPGKFFNYGDPRIRKHVQALIAAALERYDMDGIELDLLRTPGNYHSIEAMNSFVAGLAKIIDAQEKKRGHAIQLAVRVPSLPEDGRKLHIDATAWARAGHIDVIIPSNFDSLDNAIPVARWREEIGGAKCKIIPGTSYFEYETRWGDVGHRLMATPEGLRALTVNTFHEGGDAVYLYNFFNPGSFYQKVMQPDGSFKTIDQFGTMLDEGGVVEDCIDKPRRHILSPHQPSIQDVKTHMPARLKPGQSLSYDIPTGPADPARPYIVRIMIDDFEGFESAAFTVSVNQTEATAIEDMPRDPAYTFKSQPAKNAKHPSELGARVMQFAAKPNSVRDGANKITITNPASKEQRMRWVEVYVGAKNAAND